MQRHSNSPASKKDKQITSDEDEGEGEGEIDPFFLHKAMSHFLNGTV
jgi:hypothetical protein